MKNAVNQKKKKEKRDQFDFIYVKLCFTCSEKVALWLYMQSYFFILSFFNKQVDFRWQSFTSHLLAFVQQLYKLGPELSDRAVSDQLSRQSIFLGSQLIIRAITSCAGTVLGDQAGISTWTVCCADVKCVSALVLHCGRVSPAIGQPKGQVHPNLLSLCVLFLT